MSDWLEEITVTGSGPSGGGSFDWDVFDFDFDYVDYNNQGDGGDWASIDDVGQSDLVEIKLSNGLTVLADLSTLPVEYQQAMLLLSNSLETIPALKSLFDQVKAQGYSEVVLTANSQGPLAPGQTSPTTTWSQLAGSSDPIFIGGHTIASTSGDAVTITINPFSIADTAEEAVEVVVHEFVHAGNPSYSESQTVNKTDDIIDDIETINPDYGTDATGYNIAVKGIGDSGNNNLSGNSGHDNLTGNGGNDSLYGKAGNDLLNGGLGDDNLFGAAGDDEIIAGNGYDEMYGAAGNDKYVINVNMSGAIGDTSGSDDYLEIQITSNVFFSQSGNDLTIQDTSSLQTLTIYNWFNGQEIENVSLSNGTVLSSSIINNVINLQNSGGPFFRSNGDNQSGIDEAQGYLSRLVFDLDGDGLELSNQNNTQTKVDHDGNGKLDQTGWVSSDDGILVHQTSTEKTDVVDSFSFARSDESASPTNLSELATFDENADGKITADDQAWDDLFIWRDLNQDGASSDKELFSLDDIGITSISLKSSGELSLIEENIILGSASYTTKNGDIGTVSEVGLRSDINGYEWQENSALYNEISDHFA